MRRPRLRRQADLAKDGIACGRETLLLNAGMAITVVAVVSWQKLTNGSPLDRRGAAGLDLAAYIAVSAMKPSQLRHPIIPGPATRGL